MADVERVKTAMRQMMKTNYRRPPNLTVTDSSHRNCSTCVHWNGRGLCKLYSYKTRPNQVSDSWAPKPT